MRYPYLLLVGLVGLGCSAEERARSAGTGGTGGASGNGGTAGSAAQGGSSGNGGTAGAAANGGTAGSGGSAGVGATAGSGGSAGVGAAAGAAGSSGSAGTGGSAGAGGTGVVDCAGTCLPPAPTGWSGPVAMYEGTSPPACVGAFAGVALEAETDFAPGQSNCSCSCGNPSSMSCGSMLVCPGSSCGQCVPGMGITVPANSCQTTPNGQGLRYEVVGTPVFTGGSCQPSFNDTIDEPYFRAEVVACNMADPGGSCSGADVCTPALGAAFTSACIVQGGDVACPAGDYSRKVLTHTGFTDTRRCGACTCGSPTGSCNSLLSIASGCTGVPIEYATVSPGQCSVPITSTSRALFHSTSPTGSCQPSPATTTGSVAPTGAATVCCLP